ncbi:MAG: DUF4177 domain-containing protein [Armatimonas sp.]
MTFEYKIINGAGDDEEDQNSLNELGAEGWELVSVQLFAEESFDEDSEEEYVETVVTYYLKRQK